jgi:putative FmdB family regulatory protein
MPVYEYECNACQRRFERIQRLSDPLLTVCPHCGGGVRKAISAPAIHFKGGGWYVTDYSRRGGGSSKGTEASGSTGAEGSASVPPKSKPAEGGSTS